MILSAALKVKNRNDPGGSSMYLKGRNACVTLTSTSSQFITDPCTGTEEKVFTV